MSKEIDKDIIEVQARTIRRLSAEIGHLKTQVAWLESVKEVLEAKISELEKKINSEGEENGTAE